MNEEEIFNAIYEQGLWGKKDEQRFYSGSGSHTPEIVDPYVNILTTFMIFYEMLEGSKPIIVDVGCGDFAVGNRLVNYSLQYTGIDIVKELIRRNTELFVNSKMTFLHSNVSVDRVPRCDICIVRQVFQHLSNDSIQSALDNILDSCKYLILTEHIPKSTNFEPNLEIPNVGNWRFAINSGIDITKPPFSRKFNKSLILNEVEEYGGIIRTTLYKSNLIIQ